MAVKARSSAFTLLIECCNARFRSSDKSRQGNIHLFNRFHNGYNTKIEYTFEQITRTSGNGAGHPSERGFNLGVPFRKLHKYYAKKRDI